MHIYPQPSGERTLSVAGMKQELLRVGVPVAGEEEIEWLIAHAGDTAVQRFHPRHISARLVFFDSEKGRYVATLASAGLKSFRRSKLDLSSNWNPRLGVIVAKRKAPLLHGLYRALK